MAGTTLPPTRRPAWSVTGHRIRWFLNPRLSATGMIRARTAISHTHFRHRLRSGAPLVTSESRSWRRRRSASIKTAPVVTKTMPYGKRTAELARAVTMTSSRRIPRRAGKTVSRATNRTPVAQRRLPVHARSATKKLAQSEPFTRRRFRVRLAMSLTDSI